MAFAAFGLFAGDETCRPFGAERVIERHQQSGGGRFVAGDRAGIQQTCANGEVAFGFGDALFDGSRGVAHFQAQIPHKIQHVFNHTQGANVGLFWRHKQQIDIAERGEQPAAIAAGGNNGDTVGQIGAGDIQRVGE